MTVNRDQSRIDNLKKLNDIRNKVRTYTLAQKIFKQQNLGNLEELYKPLLTGQTKQLDAAQETNVKLDESKTILTNMVEKLNVNGDLTNAASTAIVNKLDKLNKKSLKKILKVVEQKPEAIALLQTLSKYPKVGEAIKNGNASGLNQDELKIFNALGVLDDNILNIFVDY